MKNSIKILVLILILFKIQTNSAQVNTNGFTTQNARNENSFIEASGFGGSLPSIGKGINFPSTNLTTFTFITGLLDSGDILNSFDGFVVYNTAIGNTPANVGGNNGVVTAVTPGFYFFSNSGDPGNVTSGQWKQLGSTSVKNIAATEIATSTSIDGKQVYALKGTFTTLGVNALISIPKPTGMTGYYKMTTYTDVLGVKKTFRSDISSFDINPTVINTENVVTGNGLFSEVYPAGDYTYTLEYFK
jgi:hypothetical protein